MSPCMTPHMGQRYPMITLIARMMRIAIQVQDAYLSHRRVVHLLLPGLLHRPCLIARFPPGGNKAEY